MTSQDSSDRTPLEYSLNAVLPISHSSDSHPPGSSALTSLVEKNNGHNSDTNRSTNDGLAHHRRSSLVKSAQISSISVASNRNSIHRQTSSEKTDVDNRQQTEYSSLKNKRLPNLKENSRKKSSTLSNVGSSYRKDFMQKIERFRFIDDSASSTTTVTSPVESLDRMNNGHETCSHLITSAIEQFDDYLRSRYQNNDEIDSFIERLNSESLTNGSYSDLNILNSSNDGIDFQPVTNPATTTRRVSESDCETEALESDSFFFVLSRLLRNERRKGKEKVL